MYFFDVCVFFLVVVVVVVVVVAVAICPLSQGHVSCQTFQKRLKTGRVLTAFTTVLAVEFVRWIPGFHGWSLESWEGAPHPTYPVKINP